jgi:hypothetical protein
MSDELVDNTGEVGTEDQDNELIKSLRAQLNEKTAAAKAAEAAAENALVEARSQLERESAAQKHVDTFGYPGLTETVLTQVEGEVTAEKVLLVLQGLQLPVTQDAANAASVTDTDVGSVTQGDASAVAQVASLGGQISAAARTTPDTNYQADMAAATTPAEVAAVAEKYGFADPA